MDVSLKKVPFYIRNKVKWFFQSSYLSSGPRLFTMAHHLGSTLMPRLPCHTVLLFPTRIIIRNQIIPLTYTDRNGHPRFYRDHCNGLVSASTTFTVCSKWFHLWPWIRPRIRLCHKSTFLCTWFGPNSHVCRETGMTGGQAGWWEKRQ